MMHPLDAFLSAIGGALTFIAICLAMLCSQTWIVVVCATGLALLVVGQVLDWWRRNNP